ncbi:MAG TPA: hypothetical protein DD473_25095 [Planctomycetaceae bacterium]|nr:hypothetical protein [Planctomycetaceae bacterium]
MTLCPHAILASDLDGTLIPLDGQPEQQRDLQHLGQSLKENRIPLIYVTGRHLQSVEKAQQEFRLPEPDWVICDVGSTICRRNAIGKLEPLHEYAKHQHEIVKACPRTDVLQYATKIPGLREQEAFKQGPYKLSFYADETQLSEIEQNLQELLKDQQIPWSLICSVDPFNRDGLVDLLPQDISKAYALKWWADFAGYEDSQIVFAGDSGNDYAAFVSGFRAILVNNTNQKIVDQVAQEHHKLGYTNRMYHAKSSATSGVLEGCRAYQLFN